jgi:DNA-directed RNA polymerase specialized sigma24 family protein
MGTAEREGVPPRGGASGPEASGGLIDLARAGDRAALRRLVDRFRAAAVAIGLSRQLGPAGAIALAERTLAAAVGRLGAFDDDHAFARAVIDQARFLPAERPPDQGDGAGPLRGLIQRGQVERRPGTGVVVRGDLEAATAALLAAVPEPARAALALRTYAGYSHAEIALLLGVTELDAAGLLAQGMDALRAAFDGASAGVGSGAAERQEADPAGVS